MFERAHRDNDIRLAIDDCLPGLENKPDFEREVIMRARGETNVKKKLSAGLVLAVVLALLAATALAAALIWQDYAAQVRRTEHEQGDYANWPIDDKKRLVEILMDVGCIQESDATESLFADETPRGEKNALADGIILKVLEENEYTKAFAQNDGMRAINWRNITYAIMGYKDMWNFSFLTKANTRTPTVSIGRMLTAPGTS